MSSVPVTVSVADLKDVFELLLEHLEELEGESVQLEHDFFWSLPAEHLYNVYAEPRELTVGQLSESLDNLERLLEEPDTASSYALVWLSDLLRAVGQQVVE